jgi:hypothetical protein
VFALDSKVESKEAWDGKWRFAEALHLSVEKLMQMDPDLPLLWAPFVHLGGYGLPQYVSQSFRLIKVFCKYLSLIYLNKATCRKCP